MTSKIVVNNIESDSGISSVTFTSDIELGTKNLKGHNLESTGIVTATSFSGSGASLTNLPAGNLTGTLPALDGSALTGVGVGTADSINTSGIITATSFVPTVGQLSHRNIIINGAMNVAQRGTSSTSDGYNTVDRFNASQGSTNESPTFEQVDVASGTTPYTLGFRKAFKITNGNQTSGPQNGSEIQVLYNIEAQDIVQSGWNYKSSSSFITWSFWIKSSIATNFYGYLRTYDNTAIGYAFETGNLSANTWTKIVKTIPGNANIDINNDNGVGLQIRLLGYIGTSYSDNSTPLHTWTTYSSTARVPEPPTTWYTTNDATLEITGYQVEVGSVATPFEHRSFGDELMRCYRYFYGPTGEGLFGVGRTTNASTMWSVQFPTQMRQNPSLSITSTTITIAEPNQSNFNITSASIANAHISKNSAAFYLNGTMSVSVGDNLFLTDDYLMFSAEL